MNEKEKTNLARLVAAGLEGDRKSLALAQALGGKELPAAFRQAIRRRDVEWLAGAAENLEGNEAWSEAREAVIGEARMFSPYAVPAEVRRKIW